MERFVPLVLRSLRAHASRYAFVVVVVALGFAFITVASSVSDGMRESLTRSALRHYAGHIFVMGRDKSAGSMMVVDEPEAVATAVEEAGVPAERIIRRVHEFDGATAFFHGDGARIKDLFGVDFVEEADLFAGFDYTAGAFRPDWPDDTIVLSQPVAERLSARVGDDVTVRLENRDGQVDTRTLVVRAVTAGDDLYGYARAYMARETLASFMAIGPAEYSVLGIILPELADAPRWAARLHDALAARLPVGERIDTRAEMTAEFRSSWDGVRYFTFPLPVYVGEVTNLLAAMDASSYVLLAAITLVVLAAAGVSFRILLHDRTRELGTMCAIGFTRGSVLALLVAEAAGAILVAVGSGFVLARIATRALSLMSFDWIPGFEIFLTGGRLEAHYAPGTVALNAAIVAAVVLALVAIMAALHLRRSIPGLLRGQTT